MARSKALPKPALCKTKIAAHVDEPVECPLCIETLDDTDRDFFPCPCGYQVCLFCYQRLQSEYNNTCPGCRQQYGDDLDAVRQHIERKQQQQQAESSARPAASSNSHHAGHGGHGHAAHGHMQHHAGHNSHAAHAHSHAAHAHSHAAGHRPKPGAPSTAKQRQHHEVPPGSHGRSSFEAAGSGLPVTANWVTAGASSLHNLSSMDSTPDVPPPPPAAVDESAWPTLGVAASSSNQQQQQQKHDGPVRRQSSSSSLSSMHSQQQQQQQQQQTSSRRQDPSRSSCDSTASTLTGHMEQQQQQQPEQQQQQQELERKGSGFTSVEVTTVVAGSRHSVCVPVSNHSEVSAFPEAATLLEMLQAAVNGSKLSSTEAAVQLVQLLRKLEADSQAKQQNVWLQQALANGRNSSGGGRNGAVKHAAANGTAGRPPTAPTAGAAARAPPPGFGHSKSAVYAPHLQQQDLASAAARGTPYRPVSAGQQQQHNLASQSDAYASQSSMHSVDSNSSLFSQGSSLSQSAVMWMDNGLPGVDFGAGVGGLGSGLGSGIPAAVPARLQMLWAGSNGQSQQGSAAAVGSVGAASGADSGYATLNPPPGFGNSLGFSSGLNGSRLSGSYNPLSYAAANGVAQATSTPPGFGIADMAALKQQQQQSIYRPWAS